MKFDFLLVTSWSKFDVRTQRSIARELEQKGYSTAILTPTASTAAVAGSTPTRTFNLESIDTETVLTPSEIESRFDIPSFRHLCQTEIAYFHLNYDQATERAVSIASGVDKLFSDHEFSYSLQGRGGELFRLLVHAKMREQGNNNIWNTFSPFDETVAFSTEIDAVWDTYRTIPYTDIPASERESIEEYITGFRSQKKRYSHDTPDTDIGDLSLLTNFISKLKANLSTDRPRDLKNSLKFNARKYINKNINERLLPSIKQSRNYCTHNRYVFFPLQFKEESRLTVLSPEFYDQRWIVEFLSRSLPHTVNLCIKQHPNHIGQESPQWIHNMSTKSNVTFLHPAMNAHHAIEHAEAVVVTNNTVGFEALFYPTPLVVLGNSFYSGTPAAQEVDTLRSVSNVLSDSIHSETSSEHMISSIYSLQQAAYTAPNHDNIDEYAAGVSSAVTEFIQDTGL